MNDHELTAEQEKQWAEALDAYCEYQIDSCKDILKGEIEYSDQFTDLNFLLRWYYWLKAFICLKLGRTAADPLSFDTIEIGIYDYTSYEYESWTSFYVMKGLLNWQVGISADGT